MAKYKIRNRRLLALLLLLIILVGVLASSTLINYRTERKKSLENLEIYVDDISELIARNLDNTQIYLSSVADLLHDWDLTDYDNITAFLDTLDSVNMITELELLLPGDMLLDHNGHLSDVSEWCSFTEKSREDAHIFWSREEKTGDIILRQCVPVKQDEETVAMLCGVIDLRKIPELIPSLEYGDQIEYYILERNSGQILLDTRHNTLSTLEQLSGRESVRGFSLEEFDLDLTEGRSGSSIFRSEIADQNFYTGYTPVAVEDWMVMVTIPENVALADANSTLRLMLMSMTLLLAVFLIYFFWSLKDIQRNLKASEAKLRNIHYILDVEKNLFLAHTDSACFHAALQQIAEFLSAQYTFFWRADILLPEQTRWWNNGMTKTLDRKDHFQTKFPKLLRELTEHGSYIRYTSDPSDILSPEEAELFALFRAKNMMMVPVRKRDHSLTGVLGAVNLSRQLSSTEALKQVSVSFAVTSEQHDIYKRLDQMSYVDAMTGLQNRNSFHNTLQSLDGESLDTFACVYTDANGLHEINNKLGHDAGDVALIQIAESLRASFPDDAIYRIGGDEFVVLCLNRTEAEVTSCIGCARKMIEKNELALSIGVARREENIEIEEIIQEAEHNMREDKKQYYASPQRAHQLRILDEHAARIFSRQQDTEAFLTVLAPQFKGVFFVDLVNDSIRHLFTRPYFENLLKERDGRFSKGMLLYAQQLAKTDYYESFAQLCDYSVLRERLDRGETPELVYQKINGSWIHLRIVRPENGNTDEALWIFTKRV